MSTITIRLPDNQHERLKQMAQRRGISLNKLFELFSTQALSEFDTESRFRALAAQGDPKRGLDLLDKLDKHFETAPEDNEKA